MVERLVLALLLACMAFSGCANKRAQAEAKVGPAVQRLPGVYDGQGSLLVIVPIYAKSLSDHSFYLQEMVASDPRQITSQRIVSFHPGNGRKLLQSTWTFVEPGRWRDGNMKPDLFKSMVKADVRMSASGEVSAEQLAGTELVFDAEGLFAEEGVARYRKR